MEPTNTTTVPNRSRSMLLQPEDIVPLTAEEAIADIEDAMRALTGEDPDDAERPSAGHRHLSNAGAEPATSNTAQRLQPRTGSSK